MFPKYNVISGQFLGLVETLGYFTVRGDEHECFFNYGYIKKNSFRVIPNRCSTAVFNRHRIQYEAEALLDTDFSKLLFFLPSNAYRCMNSVNLKPYDIDSREFGKYFEQSILDFENSGRKKKIRESVLKVLKNMVDLSNSNFHKSANGLLTAKFHRNKDISQVSGKRVPEDQFALSY